MTLKIDNNVHRIDLSPFLPYVRKYIHTQKESYLIAEAGVEHYKLLAYLSSQLPPMSRVADFGTYCGDSAIALASNPLVKVITCDPRDIIGDEGCYKRLPNIVYYKASALDVLPYVLDAKIIFVDIGLHESVIEKQILDFCISHEYKGIAVYDDIYLNPPMHHFWNEIKLLKYDVTEVGHYSGTGVVIFDPSSDIIIDL
jgi:hypothetical protein